MTIKYINNIQNKIFKLLPMREAYDAGDDNHMPEFLENLYINFKSLIDNDQDAKEYPELFEAYLNIVYLSENCDINYKKWRSIILRSTRLVHCVIEKIGGVQDVC